MPNSNAAQEFFNSLPSEKEAEKDYNIFEEVAPEKDKTPAEKPEEVKPEPAPEEKEGEPEKPERKKPLRSERRAVEQREYFEKQLAEERAARAVAEALLRAQQSPKDESTDPRISRLLTEVKDPAEATKIFSELLSDIESKATTKAYERFKEAQAQGDDEVNEIHNEIERNLEAIEDRYGVDLEADLTTRNAFLDFVDSIAPPDSDALPNMQKAWEYFQKTQKAGTSQVERKQQISSRSMVRSSNAKPEAKDLKPMTFEELNRGGFWDKLIGGR